MNKERSASEEIELSELLSAVWRGKWTVLILTFVMGTLAFFYAINQPNVYKSVALLAPVEQDKSLSGLQGQLGGLASLAGINLGGASSSNTQLAMEIIKSRHFVSEFIKKYDLLPDLMAQASWSMSENQVKYDPDIYIFEQQKWVREAEPPRNPKPSMQEAYKEFSKAINISSDSETGMVKLSIEHISPFVAQQWVSWLIDEINQTMKARDVEEAERSTAFLMSQLEQTKISDIREVLYKLVEEQAKTIMFANVRDEYVFKTIDPPLVSEEKSGPKRAILCILGAIFGGAFGIVIVIVRYFNKRV